MTIASAKTQANALHTEPQSQGAMISNTLTSQNGL